MFALLHFMFFSVPQTLDPYDRPWASTPSKIKKNQLPDEKLTKPAKGTCAAPSEDPADVSQSVF